ncbi:phosphotransferase enzyme family protein [Nocardia sp. NPDC058176]|uniref:phosphotransferase enzyme family protein n=1 Tax=Nocardia sp. NPDC058176 TaxID=3346368 RepID=UPI0036DEDDCF
MAEYTTLADLDQAKIRACYGIDEIVSLEPVPGGAANSSFRLGGTRAGVDVDYALTILDNDPAAAPRLAALLARLDGHFRTTELVSAVDGKCVVEIDGRVMILKQWIDGSVYPVLPAELLGKAGAALAQLHRVPTTAVTGPERLPSDGRRLTAAHRSRIADFGDRAFADWLTTRLAALDHISSGRSLALIHGDLYSDNIIVSDAGELVVIDWETACLEDPLLDLGMAVLGLGVVDGRLHPDRADAIVDGYSGVVPVTASERAGVLRDMVELSALIIAFHRYYRHNVRYPGSPAADRYREMVGIVASLPARALTGR